MLELLDLIAYLPRKFLPRAPAILIHLSCGRWIESLTDEGEELGAVYRVRGCEWLRLVCCFG